MATKKYAQIVDEKAYWVFETDVEPVFAPNIFLVNITDFTSEVREGMAYDVKTNTFSSTPESIKPTVEEIYSNQTITMQAIADLYTKMSNMISAPPVPVTDVTVIAGALSASLTWKAPIINGGSAISDYIIEVYSDNSLVKTIDTKSAALSATVSELSAGTAYTFIVKAINEIGASPASTFSAAVTPTAAI